MTDLAVASLPGQKNRAGSGAAGSLAAFRYQRDIFALFMTAKYIQVMISDPGFTVYDLAREAQVPKSAVDRAFCGRPLRWQRFLALCKWQREDPAIFGAPKRLGVLPDGIRF